MNKLYMLLGALGITAFSANAQVVYTFENLQVPVDSFVAAKDLNGGLGDTLVYFHTTWDTAFGGYWSSGFVPSTKQDKVTTGITNQYSAITGSGHNSNTYAVVFGSGNVKLSGNAAGKTVKGFNITNTTYAYFSMKNGDAFAKKFGGTNGSDPDYFYVTVKGYLNGAVKTDTVNFYLADYRFADSTQDYILDEWAWVNLSALGNVDSLTFQLASSDVGSFGMNTPAYFAIDNFTFYDGVTAINETASIHAKAFPNPVIAGQNFHIVLEEEANFSVTIASIAGTILKEENYTAVSQAAITTTDLPNGIYFAAVRVNNTLQTIKFSVQH